MAGLLGGDMTMDYDKRLQLILITFGAALLASACTTSVERHYSKEEALERDGWSEQGTDLCDLEGWYDDGECDGFCPEPDGDCDATCLAYPSCGPDEVEHASASECPADASCREVSLCGSSIWCSPDPMCLSGLVQPVCEPGEATHARWEDCPSDASCREVSSCGHSVWCSDTGDTCLAYPSCEAGETEYESASDCPADASCHEVSLCGSTIWCSSDDTPVCAGPNPAGCVSTGCEAGFVCDTTAGTAPSACGCDPESGTWTCTADVSGGACVPAT